MVSTSLFRLHSRVLLVPRCMDVGLASALRQRDTPLWSRRPPFWHTGLPPTSIASTSFAPTTVSTFVIALELTAPVIVPSVFLELPLTTPTNANVAATVMVSSPMVPSRVPLSIPVAMALLVLEFYDIVLQIEESLRQILPVFDVQCELLCKENIRDSSNLPN